MLDWLQPVLDFIKSLRFIHVVEPWEGAIHLRAGRVKRVLASGWYFTMPVLDSVLCANVTRRPLDIGPLPLTTKDGHNVTVSAVCTYEVEDVEAFLTKCEDAKEAVHDCASGALAHAVLAHDWAEVPTEPFIGAVCVRVRRRCKRYGIRVHSLEWTGVAQTRPMALWMVGGHGNGNVPPVVAAEAS